jgi:tRNA A37 threonylcarbamoyladenosine synthetase subunit TsaC/SUA5/YrdC
MLQGPDCEEGLESTILSLIDGAVQILRPGSITAEEIRRGAWHLGCGLPSCYPAAPWT